MNGRYPAELVAEAHAYALRHRLTLNVIVCAAMAEYLAKRQSAQADPAPQLHYARGHPPASAVRRQQEIMHADPRGRRVWKRSTAGSKANENEIRENDGQHATHAPQRLERWSRAVAA